MSTPVGVVKLSAARYPQAAPYHPSEAYPEYPFGAALSKTENLVYRGVRQLLVELRLDLERYSSSSWNPFGRLIEPGMTVLLKPNFVRSWHSERKDPYAMITHPSVLRAVADYVWIALQGRGRIIVADAPQYDCNWQELLDLTKLDQVETFYAGHDGPKFVLRDLRPYWSKQRHFPSMVEPLPGDPEATVSVNLGAQSELFRSDASKLYGAVYHRQETIKHHTGDQQIYDLSGTVMNADVIISIPKLKTHKKVGVTMNIKGLVGICTNKNLIVHYSLGGPASGGDQYPDGHFTPLEERLIRTERWMYDTFLARQNVPLEYLHRSIYWLHGTFLRPLGLKVEKSKRLLDAGNWYGNDSAWRMTVDLFKAFIFSDRNGKLHRNPQRRVFSVIDGVVGGENKGPLEPDPVSSAVLLGSEDFLAADIVGTRLMGFDPSMVKVFTHLLDQTEFPLPVKSYDDIEVRCDDPAWRNCLQDRTDPFLAFKPYPGWVGHLEVAQQEIKRAG